MAEPQPPVSQPFPDLRRLSKLRMEKCVTPHYNPYKFKIHMYKFSAEYAIDCIFNLLILTCNSNIKKNIDHMSTL